LQAVRTLASTAVEVVLVDRNNYHTFSPLLHQVATAELEPEQVAYSIRRILRNFSNVRFCMTDIQGINLDKQFLDTGSSLIPYDFLIVATGSTSHLLAVSGAQKYAFPLKTLPQAIALRNHILSCFEQAIHEVDALRLQRLLTFTIVGGGATGVEFAGALAELVREAMRKDYPIWLRSQVRIVLLHSGEHLLYHMSPFLSAYTQACLRKLGVEVYLQTRVSQVTKEAVYLQDNNRIDTATVVWAAGVQGQSPTQRWGVPTTRNGKVAVMSTLSIPGYPNAYVIGDLAETVQDGQPLPMLAPVAIAQGKVAAHNILKQLRGQTPIPFRYHHRASMVIISRHAAVAQIYGFSLRGFLAWLLWLGVHIAVLTGIRQRLFTLINWLWNYCVSDRVARLILTAPLVSTSNTNSDVTASGEISRVEKQ
jgi:NADH dehydrogenase